MCNKMKGLRAGDGRGLIFLCLSSVTAPRFRWVFSGVDLVGI